ncbi:RsmB/NOP family class I SAM-dependent RNA methyltransferase [Stella sp.]|uniref:RsmB/NOP family class I SAM-dependent RNA methyltransferase n=1 Tax=Stella sp. TaxID=2912054 RepID=UPI0035B2634A
MTPAARIAAAIELVDRIEGSRTPTDALLAEHFRSRRFIGAKDRAAIAETVYAYLRRRGQIDWWIARRGWGRVGGTTRARMLGLLLLDRGADAKEVAHLFDGGAYHPRRLDPDEQGIATALAGQPVDHPDQPPWVAGNYPEWLHPRLAEAFGDRVGREMAALDRPAPLDLRVNLLAGTRDEAVAALARDGIRAEPTKLSPQGLRLDKRVALQTVGAWKSGLVEVQDEGSQLVAILLGAAAGMRVVDFCAGAGGKTLAIAAGMANKGQIVACDTSARRLEGATQRLRRAGVHNVERRVLESERDKWVKRHAAGFDRVLADAPCTGTGTWRRNPDGRWRLTETDIVELTDLQARILESCCRLVKPGGRLAYATCSILPDENERQVERFLAGHPEFQVVPAADAWPAGLPCPAGDGPFLRLTPACHGTDGFFAALLERRA